MKTIYFSVFLAFIFSGCIVKQTATPTQKEQDIPFTLNNRYQVPNIPQQQKPIQAFRYPKKELKSTKPDKELKELIEGTSQVDKNLSLKDETIDTSIKPTLSPELEITQSKKDIIKFDNNIKLIDNSNQEKDVQQLDKNIINAEQKGAWTEFAYPVSIRKTHHFRKTAKQQKEIKTITAPEIKTQSEIKTENSSKTNTTKTDNKQTSKQQEIPAIDANIKGTL